MARIFISYKRVDKDKVFKIKNQIESALGEKCWIDIDGIESDAQFMNVIIKAIRECEVLLFMYSKTHAQITDFEKDWTVRELNFASKKEKRIVFVNIDGAPLSDEFEFMYGTKQQVDALSINAMNKLCSDLQSWLDIDSQTPCTLPPITLSQPSKKAQDDKLTFRVGDVEFKMIRVEGGTFTMGATREMKLPHYNEFPRHLVTLSNYFIGETPVTQALWKTVMNNNPSFMVDDNFPVENVSRNDCIDFITKLNRLLGCNFRLPTEAEWEFAARGGNISNSTQYSGSSNIDEVAWYEQNSNGKSHPVKNKNPNELGIYDMSGNVWEWCKDWYDDYKKNSQIDPYGPASGSHHICRGGCWKDQDVDCHLSCRGSHTPDFHANNLGLRLALSE